MLSELDRNDAWFIVNQIGDFDLGAWDAWEWWFKNIWRRLEASKWFEEICVQDSPVYPTQQRITLFALRWIAEDFVNVLDGSTDIEWSDWISMLDLDADNLLRVVRGHEKWQPIEEEVRDYTGEADVYENPEFAEYNESIQQEHEEVLMSRLLPQAACFAAALQRQRLIPWLKKLFPRTEHLFQSMWCVARSGGAASLPNEDDEIRAGIEEVCPFDHRTDPDLSPDLATQLNARAMAAFTDSLDFDAETAERIHAWEWVEGGCRIRNQGYPQYGGPWQD